MIKLELKTNRLRYTSTKSNLAGDLSWALRNIYLELNRQYVVDGYFMGLISTVIKTSTYLEIPLMDKNHRLKMEEAIKIEAIAGLSHKLETLVETLIKSGELKFEGRENILKIVKPLLWLTRFTDSKLHVDLMDYEKRKKRVFGRGRCRLRDPNELLILYSERSFTILMASEERILKRKKHLNNTNVTQTLNT